MSVFASSFRRGLVFRHQRAHWAISQSRWASPTLAFLSTDTASSATHPADCNQNRRSILPISSHPTAQLPRSSPIPSDYTLSSNTHQEVGVTFTKQSDHLRVDFGDGSRSNFHYIWLRDNCRCETCFHSYTKQRLLDTFQIPLDIHPSKVIVAADGLSIQWSDKHSTFVPFSFLKEYSYDPPIGKKSISTRSERTFWDRSIAASMPAVHFEALFQHGDAGEKAVLDWLRNINRYGFCLVDGVPLDPAMTEKLLCRIAFIRETHYGGFWDFTADMEHGDTAYTNLPLGAHTDTTYFSDPAGLQLFHLLSPTDSHSGGTSLLVDGFAVASRLKEKHAWAYETLSNILIDTHASGGQGIALRPLLPSPILTHDPRSGELAIIRWNPDDRRPLRAKDGEELKRWYRAAREWETILRSRDMQLWTQMKQGQALIFDNHRVLHGRSGFEGSRRLCGGYINGDDYRSRLRALEYQFRENNLDSRDDSVWQQVD